MIDQKSNRLDSVILFLGLLCLAVFVLLPLVFPDPNAISVAYLSKLRLAAGMFYGNPPSDIATDIVGMRALVKGIDPYQVLGPALEELGIHWDLNFQSPRLPMGFLFTAPVAFLPWAYAAPLWALLMIGCWITSLRLLGLSWKLSIGIGGLLLFWPPAMFSLGQLTPIWLFMLCLAFALREERPSLAGAAIGIAAMTKYTPIVVLVNFARSKRMPKVLSSTFIVSLAAIAGVFVLNPSAVARFLAVNRTNYIGIFERLDNAAPFAVWWRLGGWVGLLGWMAFLTLVIVANWRSVSSNTERGWMITFYLSVWLLPVLWIYSILPLLPVVKYVMEKETTLSRVCALGGLALTFAGPAFGQPSVLFISGSVLLFGTALLISKIKWATEKSQPTRNLLHMES